MSEESRKNFNAMLASSKDMPKIQIITDIKTIERYGGNRMLIAPPIYYDRIMKRVPEGKLLTVSQMREYLAEQNGADFTDPMTAGIFVTIAAWASAQRGGEDETPWWRTVKANGELNPKYPGGVDAQRKRLEAEGHTIIAKGRKTIRYFVKDYATALFTLE